MVAGLVAAGGAAGAGVAGLLVAGAGVLGAAGVVAGGVTAGAVLRVSGWRAGSVPMAGKVAIRSPKASGGLFCQTFSSKGART